MKLTTICDVSHMVSYTRPSSPLFFSGDIERKAWERGYKYTTHHLLHCKNENVKKTVSRDSSP